MASGEPSWAGRKPQSTRGISSDGRTCISCTARETLPAKIKNIPMPCVKYAHQQALLNGRVDFTKRPVRLEHQLAAVAEKLSRRLGGKVLIPPQRNIQQRPASSRQERQDFLKLEKVYVVPEFFHFFQKVASELRVIPVINRYSKALLLAIDKFVWNKTPHRFFQNVFEHPVLGFSPLLGCSSPAPQTCDREKVRAFQTHRHTHLVHAHQQQGQYWFRAAGELPCVISQRV